MRFKVYTLIISACFIILSLCLFWAQVIRGGYYYRLSQNNRIRLVPEEACRGDIFDSKGKLLAASGLSYDLVISPQEIKNKKEKARLLERIGAAADIPFHKIEAAYKKNYIAPFADVVIIRNISKGLIFKIEQMNLELPAVSVKPRPQRSYAFNEATSHLLGYLGEIDRGELDELRQYGYRRQDLIGKSGLEKYLDMPLRGEDGGMQIEVNNRNYQAGILSSRQPKKGVDIRLTVDSDLEACAYSLLSGRRGAVVVLGPDDGRVLCMVSSPGFDSEKVSSALDDPAAPLLNRAIQNQYPPGSIFKIITATAGLETKKITARAPVFYCPGFISLGGRRFNCWEQSGHGRMDLLSAFKQSCNVFFFKASEKIGQEPLSYYARLFGLGQRTRIELDNEAKGFVPDKNWKRRVIGDNWYDGDTLNFSIGQGYVLITPLQAAVMVSVIANSGRIVQPYVVESIGNVRIKRQQPKQLPVSISTIDIIREGLYNAVQSDAGTGILARADGINVSGKTGTAQVAGHQSHAWFVGYAPSENPKAAIAVFLENGGYGGDQAAPIAGAMFKKMKQLGML